MVSSADSRSWRRAGLVLFAVGWSANHFASHHVAATTALAVTAALVVTAAASLPRAR